MIWEAIIDFIFPKVCAGCGKWGVYLCSECRERLDFVDQICPMCGEGSPMGWTHPRCKTGWGMDGLISIYEYQEPVARAVVDGVKYDFNKELVEIVLEGFSFQTGENFDYLVPVPLHYYRENWRGFNQAELIAQVIGPACRTGRSRMTNIKLERLLKRVRNTKQQVTMKTKEERETNIKKAFVVDSRWRRKLKDKKVLLIDDVFTSGADMRECTKILKKAGVAVVWGLSLAH